MEPITHKTILDNLGKLSARDVPRAYNFILNQQQGINPNRVYIMTVNPTIEDIKKLVVGMAPSACRVFEDMFL